MLPKQWEIFKRAARGERLDPPPVALIIDSPWIPGCLGLTHYEYYLDPEIWFQANLKIVREFPQIIFFPSWWVEYGMAAEPSLLGCKIRFWPNQTPNATPCLKDLADLTPLKDYNVAADGFAALTLERLRLQRSRILDAGHLMPVATARGPLCTAGFVRGQTELMMDILMQPDETRALLELTTQVTIDWLKAQAAVLGDQAEAIFILDDIVGFLGEEQYLEFAHPCLKRICDAFPPHWIKVYHNDAGIAACLDHLPDCGFHVLNWGKQTPIAEVRRRIGNRLCLMGNVNPLETGVHGTPQAVRDEALRIIEANGDGPLILSFGGGVSPGCPKANIQALAAAACAPGGVALH